MIEFVLALAAFLAAHALPAASGLRERLIGALGRGMYLTLYSALSLGLLAWLVSAASRADYLEIWPPGALTAWAPLLAMGPALYLLIGALSRPNPLSVSFRAGQTDPREPGPIALNRHAALWGFALWAFSHAIANGDLVSLILFGGLGGFSLMGMRAFDRRAKRRLSAENWISARTVSAGARKARLQRMATPRAALELAAAAVLYAWLLHAHPLLFGADPLGWLR